MTGGAVAALPEGLLDTGLWFRVEATGTASAVRRTAERLAVELGLPDSRAAALAIVAAEVAGNLVKHANEGRLLLRPVRTGGQPGVELIAVDSGPGMADLGRAFGDGHSTAGTLGIGLGAVVRQASWWDVHSAVGRGTVLAVQVWSADPPPPAWAAGVVRPLTGEPVSGDGFAVRTASGRRQVLVCDGLGHGRAAAHARHAAVHAFHDAPAEPPADVVERVHTALRTSRGAAVAVAELDAAVIRYAGLGNISGTVVGPDGRRGMVSLPGIAGHHRRSIRQYEYPLTADALVVLHTDGVVDRWSLTGEPGLIHRSPVVVAAALLRDYGTRRDDACVVVARPPAWP